MEELALYVEQLDAAGKFIRKGGPISGRLALILSDNVVELLFHRYAERRFRSFLYGREFSPAKRREVLAKYFGPKVSFIASQGLITADEADLCREAHELRNAAYHVGLLHNDFIAELAATYYSFACDAFLKLQSRTFEGREEDSSPVVQNHAGGPRKNPRGIFSEEGLSNISNSLLALKPPTQRSLSASLSSSAMARLTTIREDLNFVVENDPRGRSRDELQDWIQRSDEIWSGFPDGTFRSDNPEDRRLLAQKHAAMRDWKPPVSDSTIDRWEERARAIAIEPKPGAALVRLHRLTAEFESYEGMVFETARALDQHIEEQIDEMKLERPGRDRDDE